MRGGAVSSPMLAALVALGALPAAAADLELGLETGAVYDDNVFSSATDPQSDVAGRIGPIFRVLDETGAVTWQVHYRPTYEKYLDLSEADGWDHDLDADLAWSLSPRTTVRIGERFLDTSDPNAAFVAGGEPDAFVEPALRVGSSRSRYNQAQLSVDHLLAPRHQVALVLARYDTSYEGSAGYGVTSIDGSYLYAFGPLTRLGLRLSGTQQDLDGVDEPTRFYNLSFQWLQILSPTLTFQAAVGPALIDQPSPEFVDTFEAQRYPGPVRASTCPRAEGGLFRLAEGCQAFPPNTPFADTGFLGEIVELRRVGSVPSDQTSLTYFASVSLSKQWREFELTLGYDRDASNSSQLSGVVSDIVSVHLRWSPPARGWGVSLFGQYQRRTLPSGGFAVVELLASSTVAGVSDVGEAVGFRVVDASTSANVTDYLAGLYVTYDLSRRTQLYWNVSWQMQDVSLPGATRWDRLRIGFGVIYTLPRIRLPI